MMKVMETRSQLQLRKKLCSSRWQEKKKRVAAELVDGDDVVEKVVPTEEETGTKQKKEKKQKKHNIDDQDISPMADAPTDVVSKKKKKKEENDEGNGNEVTAAIEEEVVLKKKKKKDGSAEAKQPGEFFQREDWSKWAENIKDENLKNNTYEATKLRVNASDTYGDKAAEDLGKVKGKGFKKEMAKKKRASWRGGGELDQGIKSVPFPDSSDEE